MKSFFIKPSLIYLFWMLLYVGFCFIAIPILTRNKGGGADLNLFALSIVYFVRGLLFISIVTFIFYREWTKEYWFVNLLVFLGSAIFLIFG